MDSSPDHDLFIRKTDRTSLFRQIQGLVVKAQEVDQEELKERQQRMQKLLEYEDKIYEEEFASKVKSRIDEDIRARKDALVKIKEENMENAAKFLQKKRIQQQMKSCYEIREALRHKEQQIVKNCQLEQIVDKERQQRRQIEADKYWMEVTRKNVEVYETRQKQEDCLRQSLMTQTKFVLDKQLEEKAEKEEEARKEKLAEAEALAKLLEEIRIEEFDKQLLGMPAKMLEYRKELLDMIAQNEQRRRSSACEKAQEHLQMMLELQRLEQEDNRKAREKKKALHNATMEYIAYVRRMRKLEEGRQKMANDRIDDLHHVDICTKNNLAELARIKAVKASECYAELRKQICEQYERKIREEAERREDKILENLFAKPEKSRADVLAQRTKNRLGLDQQIEDLKKFRQMEEEKFSKDLLRAIDEPELCKEMAERVIREGIDYLEPHANWRIYACPLKEYVEKPPANSAEEIPPSEGCIDPCGCNARANVECRLHNPLNTF